MSNRARKDEDVFDMGRETPEGKAVHSSPGDAGVMERLWDAVENPEPPSTEELAALAHDVSEAVAGNMRFVPAEEIDAAIEELADEPYDHQHDGNAICPSCGGVFVQHYQFLMPCRANDIGRDDLVEVCNPEDYFAYREDDGSLVIYSPGGERWEYCSYEHNDGDIMAECSHTPNHVIWNCRPIGKKDPVTEEFMRSISS